ncbi:hypothetical protein IWZ03DRAFT_372192 [Phyllosticta citriasiana]|uniref:Secreted protein n=1 Tax=Phyllosticta citriasiana TaxID=595635 RepID=A0ABR1KRE6_9PEZI
MVARIVAQQVAILVVLCLHVLDVVRGGRGRITGLSRRGLRLAAKERVRKVLQLGSGLGAEFLNANHDECVKELVLAEGRSGA